MSAVVRGNALTLPLRDESVDLIVTSPPYFALRSYQDDGGHYAGQIGSEPTPQAFLDALWAVTAECVRVLKPSGSMFVNLGDKYSGAGGPGGDYNAGGLRDGQPRIDAQSYWSRMAPANSGIPAKSLMLIPEAYRLGCNGMLAALGGVDTGLRLRARAVLVWSKPNGLPESVTDRVRRSHEDWVHLTKQGRYFSAVDEIREAHAAGTVEQVERDQRPPLQPNVGGDGNGRREWRPGANPLGKLPGSVWTIPSEPLVVPDWLGVDHFAAFPQEWPRRLILGWSPSGICVECGEGRRPVVDVESIEDRRGRVQGREGDSLNAVPGRNADGRNGERYKSVVAVTGYACACPDTTAPTRPAVVLDPFGGTGTTAMVARALGRTGINIDLSADYCRLARWRIFQSGHASKARERTNRENQGALL